MMEDMKAIIIALAHFIISFDLTGMLLETDDRFTLQFTVNNYLSLRAFIGDDNFIELVMKVVELNKSNYAINILLLDKIKDFEQVLIAMIEWQKDLIDKHKPLEFVSASLARDYS